jgi:hypothetical protein
VLAGLIEDGKQPLARHRPVEARAREFGKLRLLPGHRGVLGNDAAIVARPARKENARLRAGRRTTGSINSTHGSSY